MYIPLSTKGSIKNLENIFSKNSQKVDMDVFLKPIISYLLSSKSAIKEKIYKQYDVNLFMKSLFEVKALFSRKNYVEEMEKLYTAISNIFVSCHLIKEQLNEFADEVKNNDATSSEFLHILCLLNKCFPHLKSPVDIKNNSEDTITDLHDILKDIFKDSTIQEEFNFSSRSIEDSFHILPYAKKNQQLHSDLGIAKIKESDLNNSEEDDTGKLNITPNFGEN